MIDFKITDNGDIDLVQPNQYPHFLLTFTISPLSEKKENERIISARRFNSFRIDFDTEIMRHNTDMHGFMIQFYTDHNFNDFSVNARPVFGNEELAQEVTIRLKTERGEFPFLKEFGSELVSIRHTDIRSEETLTLAKQYTEEAISDIITEDPYTVNVERVEDEENRYRYERLKITIDTERDKIYEAAI